MTSQQQYKQMPWWCLTNDRDRCREGVSITTDKRCQDDVSETIEEDAVMVSQTWESNDDAVIVM